MALPPLRLWFWATCAVTCIFRHSATNPCVSKPLSPPTVTGCVPGNFSNITSAASRSALPLAWNTSAATISPVAVLHQQIPAVTQLRLLALALARHPCLRIGLRLMRFVRPLLPSKVHGRVAGIIRRSLRFLLFRLETLRSRPSFQQRPIYREMFIGSQALGPRLPHYLRQKLFGYVGLQQPIAILRERGRVPHLGKVSPKSLFPPRPAGNG